jgi:hypothetical protein
MIRRLLNLTLIILLSPLLIVFIREGAVFLASVFTIDSSMWFLLGAALSLLGYILLLNNHIDFIEHLLHEMEHAALSFLFSGKLPRRMEIDPEQGSKVFIADRGGCLTALAPYYLPLLMVPFLILKALAALALSLLNVSLPTVLAAALDLLIGATLMFHYVCTLKEFSSFQSDIKQTGVIASLVGVFFLNFVFLVLAMTVVTGSYAQLLDDAKTALAAAVDTYRAALEFLMIRLLPGLGELVQTIEQLLCKTCTPTPGP